MQKRFGLNARRNPLAIIAAVLVLFAGPHPAAQADSGIHSAANFASGTGNIIFLAAAVGLPLLRDGQAGKDHALRAADAIGTSALLAEGIKMLVKEQRPDHSDHDSFPSGHATAAFAAAGMESAFHPREAPLWFLGAALIGESRTTLHRHFPRDVIAGGLLGYGIARLEISSPRGLILSPIIGPGNSVGLTFTAPMK